MIESLIALAPWLRNIDAFRKSGRVVVEESRTGFTLDQHLNDNNSDQRPYRSTKSNRKPLSKGIESPTVLNVGSTEALCGRHKNVTGITYKSETLPRVTWKTRYPFHSTIPSMTQLQ